MDYTALSLAEIRAGLEEVARDADRAFGGFDAHQLNWRPDATRWSAGQCLEHLLRANRLMLEAADQALNAAAPTAWQRLPVVPGVLGRMLVRSQAPGATRRFTAPAASRPAASDVAPDIVRRFVEQHHDALARSSTLDERTAAGTIMTSPFAPLVVYSVLDGWRLVFAHDRRHLEQAHRVTRSPGFPGPPRFDTP